MAAAASGAAAAASSATQQAPTPRGGSLGRQAMEAVDSGEVSAGEAGSAGAQGAEAMESVSEENANPFGGDNDPFKIPDEDSQEFEVEGFEDEQAQQDQQQQQQKTADSRSQKRIRSLIEQQKRLHGENQGMQRQLQQFQQWSRQAYEANNQLQQRLHQQEVEMARLKTQMEMGPARQKSEDPVEQFKQDLLDKSLGRAKEELSPQLQQALSKVEQLQQHLDNERKEAENTRVKQQYNQQTDTAIQRHVAPFMTESGFKKLSPRLGSYVLQEAMLSGTDFESAAKNVRNFMFELARDVMQRRSKTDGAKIAAGKQVPSPAKSGRADTKAEDYPPWELLRKNNMKSYVEWEARGRPKLR